MILHSIVLYTFNLQETIFGRVIGFEHGILLLVGTIFSLLALKNLSGKIKTVGRIHVVTLMSFAVSMIVWAYYAVATGVESPYPSISDVFFALGTIALTITLFVIAYIYKSSITKARLWSSIILGLVAGFGMYLLTGAPELTDTTSFVTTAFDVFWGLSAAITSAVAVTVMRLVGGQIYRGMFVLTLAVLVKAVADVLFTIRVAEGIYWNGDISDILYVIAWGMLAYTVLELPKYVSGGNKSEQVNI